jgi:hypothetical protein
MATATIVRPSTARPRQTQAQPQVKIVWPSSPASTTRPVVQSTPRCRRCGGRLIKSYGTIECSQCSAEYTP